MNSAPKKETEGGGSRPSIRASACTRCGRDAAVQPGPRPRSSVRSRVQDSAQLQFGQMLTLSPLTPPPTPHLHLPSLGYHYCYGNAAVLSA